MQATTAFAIAIEILIMVLKCFNYVIKNAIGTLHFQSFLPSNIRQIQPQIIHLFNSIIFCSNGSLIATFPALSPHSPGA